MEVDEHLNIMNISYDQFNSMNLLELKRHYHSMAKKHHPDKGGSTAYFQKVNSSYTKLNEIKLANFSSNSVNNSNVFEYMHLMRTLLESKELSVFLYNKCQNVLQNIMTSYCEYIAKKQNQKQTIIELNPSEMDMYTNNLCKYDYRGSYFLVPLWHSEVHFEHNGEIVIFICQPELSDEMMIDRYNHTHVNVRRNISDIINDSNISIIIYGELYHIPICELHIRTYQIYTLCKKGLSEICTGNIYDTTKKMDIVVHIYLNF